MAKNKDFLTKDTAEVVRNFRYSKGKCNLSFSLRIDIKQDLKDFNELLKEAIVDIEKELSDKK